MKIKDDFVTNSSSTAYFFIFNGETKEDLFKAIMKRPERFDFEYEYGFDEKPICCDANFIVDSINKVYGTDGGFYTDELCIIKPIDELIEDFKATVESSRKYYIDENNRWYRHYYTRHKNQLKAILEAKEKGLDKYLQINFGTSEGHIHEERAYPLHGIDFFVKRKDLYVISDVRS